MARFDLVAFDCDGVLVDTEPLTCGVLTDMLNEVGWQVSLEETMKLFVGRLVRDELPMIERHATLPVPADFYPQFVARRNAALEAGVNPVRNVRATVETLAARGMPFCVVSGADRAKMRLTLGQTGLLRWFDGRLFSGMEVARTKPAPDVYLLAAQTMGVDPARCAVVEDTPTGVAAVVAAGMTVFGYAERIAPQALLDAGAALAFDDMARLPELVQ
jgi:HAD superfamily hydrolase (TIGR01509 family)